MSKSIFDDKEVVGKRMKIDLAEIDERITKCQKILDSDPNSQIFAALADAYRKKGLAGKALEICTKGIEKHPDYGSAYIVLAKIHLDQGNHVEAERQLQKAMRVGGRTRSADVLEAEILIKMGNIEKARRLLEKLHNSDPRNETIKGLLISLAAMPPEPKEKAMPIFDLAHSPEAIQPAAKKTYTLSHALGIIKILPRVLGVVAVAKNGMVIEGHFDGLISRDEMGALATAAFSGIAQAVGRIHFGDPKEILVEAEQSKLWIFDKGRLLIVISTRDDVNLGSLKLKINEIIKQTEF